MSPLRIAILIPDLRGGGAERVAVNIANDLIRRGYLVDMVLLSSSGIFLPDLHTDIRLVDLGVQRISSALVPIFHYFRETKPCALLANMWPLTVIAIFARMLAKVTTRVVVVEHTTWSRDPIVSSTFGRWKVKTTMRLTYPIADAIVAVSKGAANDLSQFANLEKKVINVIYNPIVGNELPPIISPSEPSEWWSGEHRRILAVGNLIPIKDYKTLLKAIALVRKKINVRLLILGEGVCRKELELYASELDINNYLYMPGFIKNPLPYLKKTDLLVLSSVGEGFGNVLVEALSVGTPVVSTDCQSGPREILADGEFGHLVPIGNEDKLANAICNSLLNLHDKNSLISRAQDYSICKAVDKYEQLLVPTV